MNIETANRLLKYRKSRGYSQEELAEKIEVSRQAILKWERSEASPDTDNLIMLAKIYGVTLDELIQGESDPAQTQTETADDNRYVDEPDPDTNYVKEEKVSFKRGIHVDDKNGQVDISFREGINVNSSDGSHVHVGRDGVHVYDGEKVRAYTDENGNVMVDEELKGMSKHSKHIADRVPVWAISLIAMLVWGFSGVAFGFALSWICLLAIPIYHSLVDAIYKKNPLAFRLPRALRRGIHSRGLLQYPRRLELRLDSISHHSLILRHRLTFSPQVRQRKGGYFMKKIIIPVIILALLFSACSCYPFEGLNQKEVCEDLVKAFDQNDIDAAKKLFSDKVKKDVDLDKQLKEAFKYYNSKSVSTKYRESTGGSSVDPEGDDNYWECCDMIVRTKDTTFLFSFTMITFNDDSDRMGISELCVFKNYNEKKGSFDDSFAFVGEHIYTDWESEEKDICIYTLSEQSFDPYSDFDDYNGEYIADNTSLEEDDFSFIVKDGKMEIWIEKFKSFEEDEIQELVLSGRIENYSGDSFDLVVEKVNPKYEKNRKVGDVITFKPDQ